MMNRIYLSILSSLLLCACMFTTRQPHISANTPVLIDSTGGACPYLTKDSKGNIVLSWVKTYNDSSAIFCYATSTDGGASFGKPVEIPSSNNVHPHSENIPKVIFKPSGEIIALWGSANPNPKNKYSGIVYYSQSFDDGKTWSTARQLVNDTAGYDQRYFDVALLKNGEAAVIWLDNRKKSDVEGSGLYYAATSGKKGFVNERMIGEGCCQCCRTDLFVDNKNNLHVLYRGIIADSIRDMVHTVSIDGGKSFSQPKKISNDNWVLKGCPHTGPAMTENKEGLHFAWFTGGLKKGSFYTSSKNNGASFVGEDSISQLGRHPQLAVLPNEDIITVWDEAIKTGNRFNSLIGVQLRASNGKSISKQFITDSSFSATYPVTTTIEKNTSVVAYCKEQGKKTYIAYQRVQFN